MEKRIRVQFGLIKHSYILSIWHAVHTAILCKCTVQNSIIYVCIIYAIRYVILYACKIRWYVFEWQRCIHFLVSFLIQRKKNEGKKNKRKLRATQKRVQNKKRKRTKMWKRNSEHRWNGWNRLKTLFAFHLKSENHSIYVYILFSQYSQI